MDESQEIKTTQESPVNIEKVLQVKEILLDPEKNIWITLGIPGVPDKTEVDLRKIRITSNPYVFKVDNLKVFDKDHTRTGVIIKDVNVIMAHGYRGIEIIDNRKVPVWRFDNGQGVVETVRAYNKYATKNNLPKVDFLISCNDDTSENPLGIRVGEFDQREAIVYPVGEKVSIGGSMGYDRRSVLTKQGEVNLEVEAKDNFFGLDDLIAEKSIKILDQV